MEGIRSFFHAINHDQKGIRLSLPLHVLDFIVQKFPQHFDEISKYMG
jgi:hypothetical protein